MRNIVRGAIQRCRLLRFFLAESFPALIFIFISISVAYNRRYDTNGTHF